MTPIERAAKAIYERRNGKGCRPWSRLPKAHQEPYTADAMAASEVLTEGYTALVDLAKENGFDSVTDAVTQAKKMRDLAAAGYVIVPREPTQAIRQVMNDHASNGVVNWDDYVAAYIAAAQEGRQRQ